MAGIPNQDWRRPTQEQAGGLENQIRNLILSNSPVPQPEAHLPHQNAYTGNRVPHPSQNAHQAQYQGQQFDRHGQGQPDWRRPRQGYQTRQGPPPAMNAQHRQYGNQHYSSFDPNAFQSNGPTGYSQPQQQRRQLFNPKNVRGPPPAMQPDYLHMQTQYLESVTAREIPLVEMTQAERDEKEAFRKELESVCHQVCDANPSRLPKVLIECFGSFQSGFASAGSDMDLVLVVQGSTASDACFSLFEDDLPRALEKRLLQLGYGARLLTRTRVPIIKICQLPSDQLLSRLRQERSRWDGLDQDMKYPHLKKDEDEATEGDLDHATLEGEHTKVEQPAGVAKAFDGAQGSPNTNSAEPAPANPAEATVESIPQVSKEPKDSSTSTKNGEHTPHARREQPWIRERKAGPLDFPKDGVGIQSDINFFNPLGLHNTQLLRCYSLCDPRVRPMILFVKSWAKRRKINSAYNGTLSSYGYVLMVLHYLVNIASPPVLPNLQGPWRPQGNFTPQGADATQVDDWQVDFWRRDDEITHAASTNAITANTMPLGALLVGFFNYYSSQGGYPSFHWMQNVLSLRTPGGILSKEEKGWVKAVREQTEGREVQHRYLFCIEDPFELSHNVARTVTHFGIVAVRDEFRRANRILRAVAQGLSPRDGDFFDVLVEPVPGEQQQQQDAQNGPAANTQGFTPAQHQAIPQRTQLPPRAQPIDLASKQAFPTLSGRPAAAPAVQNAKPTNQATGEISIKPMKQQSQKQRKQAARSQQSTLEVGEISGDRAKAYLEGLKKKREEEAAGVQG